MNELQAYETYINGNKGDFKEWLKGCTKEQLIKLIPLWLCDNKLDRLLYYIKEVEE